MRIKLYDNNGNEKVFNTESNGFLSALKEIYLTCDGECKEHFFKSVTGDDIEKTTTDSINDVKNFFKVESFNDLDLFSVKTGTGVIACKAKVIAEMTKREITIATNSAVAMRVYKKLEAENKVYSEDYIDLAQLTRDCVDISMEYLSTCGKEYGWTEKVTDFIESKLLEIYGI